MSSRRLKRLLGVGYRRVERGKGLKASCRLKTTPPIPSFPSKKGLRGKILERTIYTVNAIISLSSPYPSKGLERRRWTVFKVETVINLSSPSQKPLERVEGSDQPFEN